MSSRVNGTIPSELSLEGLAGEELLSVMLGKHHIELVFESMRLNVEGGYDIVEAGTVRAAASRENLRSGAASLTELVGSVLVRAEWVHEEGLRLRFSNGVDFTAKVDGSGFESFSFNIPGSAGVVVV